MRADRAEFINYVLCVVLGVVVVLIIFGLSIAAWEISKGLNSLGGR